MPVKAKGIPTTTNLGALLSEISNRMDALERAFMDLAGGSASERVIDKMIDLEWKTTETVKVMLDLGKKREAALEAKSAEISACLDKRVAECRDLSAKLQKDAQIMRAELKALERVVESRVGTLIEGVDNRFSNETKQSIDVIHGVVDTSIRKINALKLELEASLEARAAASIAVSGAAAGVTGQPRSASQPSRPGAASGAAASRPLAASGAAADARSRSFLRQQAEIIRRSREASPASSVESAQRVARLRSPPTFREPLLIPRAGFQSPVAIPMRSPPSLPQARGTLHDPASGG